MERLGAYLNHIYEQPCAHCGGWHHEPLPSLENAKELPAPYADLVKELYQGTLGEGSLHAATALDIAKNFMDAVFDGYGKTFDDVAYDTPDYDMLAAIENNVFHFSAAKTWQMQKALSLALKDGDKLRTFEQFRQEAAKVLDSFVGSWMRTEYDTAIAGAQMAGKWVQFEKFKDVLPSLKYETAGDDRVRRDHQALDGVVKPVDDAFWNTYYPPNGWNCRCDVVQMPHHAEPTPNERIQFPEVPPMFRRNLAKDGKVFPDKHPYNKDLPKEIKKQAAELQVKYGEAFIPAKTVAEAEQRILAMTSGKPEPPHMSANGILFDLNFKGAKLHHLNEILNGMEDTIGKYSLQVDGIGWHKKTRQALGCYTHTLSGEYSSLTFQRKATLEAEKMAVEQRRIFEANKAIRLDRFKKQMDDFTRPESVRKVAKENYEKMLRAERWGVFDSTDRPLYATAVHEGMHAVWFKKKLSKTFADNLEKFKVTAHDWHAVSEYGASSLSELWAETGAAYHCGTPMPEGIKNAFLETLKTIEL